MKKISRRNFIKTGLVAAAVSTLNLSASQDEEAVNWDQEFDILIVGSGLSANVAGIVAAEGGLSVALLEKMSRTGGNSVISQLDFACVGSEQQEKAGIKDSIELFVKDLNRRERALTT